MNTAIAVKGLIKSYKDFRLEVNEFSIPKGCIVGLVGENGAGKTTLLACMLGSIHKDSGEILVGNTPVDSKDCAWKEDVGVVLAECNFPETLNAKQVSHVMKDIYKNWSKAEFEHYLKAFQLDEEKEIRQYSRGMKMKLQIAIALSHQAKILIFDEATSGLDPVVRDEILNLMLEFMQDAEHSILVSSHIIGDLEKIADYITFLHEGKIIFTKNKDELLEEYGVVRCKASDYEQMDAAHVVGMRKNQFSYEVMIDNRKEYANLHHEVVVDATTIEEIILFMIKGEKP